jgi:HSP20 family protein
MAEKTVATPNGQQAVQTTEGTRTREWYIAPAVDIYEMPEELVVLADLPGVSGENVNVRVDNNILTIQGYSRHMVPGEPMYREYALAHFFRQFELTERIDPAKISAELKHGVLTLHLPKAEAAKPRQIAVAVAA